MGVVDLICPVAMVVVPSRNDGVSDSPDELTTAADLATGIDVLLDALLRHDGQLDTYATAGTIRHPHP